MANKKQRFISTSFWDDPWVQSLTPLDRYLYLYLLTNTLTNIAGVYEISTRRIGFDTGLSEKAIENTLSIFTKSRKAVRVSEFIILPAWPDHQKWEKSPKIKAGIDAILETLPHHIIKCLVYVEYRYPMDSLFSVETNSKYPLNYLDIDSDFDIDTYCFSQATKKQERVPKFKPTEYTQDFLLFWESYPKKKKKVDAFKAWNQMKADRPPVNVIVKKIQQLTQTPDWKKDSGQFIPHPASWLRAGGWDDEVEVVPGEETKPTTFTAQIRNEDDRVTFKTFQTREIGEAQLKAQGFTPTGAEWRKK